MKGRASCPDSEKMEVRTHHRKEKKEQDADQDYPQSSPEIQIICVRSRTLGWVEGAPVPTLEVEIQPRSNSRPVCSGCGHKRPGYDRSPQRLFEFIPMWGIKVFFRYAPRRVDCPGCGVRVERMPWVSGKHRLTEAYAWFLAGWANRLSWKEVAEAFRTSWDHVFCSVEMAVSWGRAHQERRGQVLLFAVNIILGNTQDLTPMSSALRMLKSDLCLNHSIQSIPHRYVLWCDTSTTLVKRISIYLINKT